MKKSFSILLLLTAGWLCASCEKEESTPETPLAADMAEVRGNLIDIRTMAVGELVFPQHNGYRFADDLIELPAQPTQYAIGLMESRGPEAFRLGKSGMVYLASDCSNLQTEGWTQTGTQFMCGEVTYYVHKYNCTTPGKWITIPNPATRKYTTLLLGTKLRVAAPAAPGTVIARVPELRGGAINNVCMTILPNGNYIAACTGASGSENPGATLFLSQDKGRTWSVLSRGNLAVNGVGNYFNMFVFDGALYMMGTGAGGKSIVISRSTDNGRSWTFPADDKSGLLFTGDFHSSSVPVIVAQDRIWRAMEAFDGTNKNPFVLSAPVDADLLDAASWTKTETIPYNSAWVAENQSISELIEGNMVATPDGTIYNILRASCSKTSLAAARVTVMNPRELKFAPPGDFIHMPGGGKKFTIRYDARSKRYWTITNPASSTHYLQKHNGIYASGITYDLIRNRMVLCYSDDLTTWIQAREIIDSTDPFFHGFQYTDWLFDGEDIVAVCRMACPEERGLPTRQHDANMISFLRIRNFRN